MNLKLPESIGVQFTFNRRPEPVPGEFRPRWKIAVILLSLRLCGRGSTFKASIGKLKILSWASRNSASQLALFRFLDNHPQPDDVLLRHEPVLVRALNLAAGMGLVSRSGDIISLTEMGASLADSIKSDSELLIDEKRFFSAVAKRLTEGKTNQLTEPQ